LKAIIDDLKINHFFGSATDVILSGDSAGGLATFWHAELFASSLGENTHLVAAPDSGFFFDDTTNPVFFSLSYKMLSYSKIAFQDSIRNVLQHLPLVETIHSNVRFRILQVNILPSRSS